VISRPVAPWRYNHKINAGEPIWEGAQNRAVSFPPRVASESRGPFRREASAACRPSELVRQSAAGAIGIGGAASQICDPGQFRSSTC
jgi:hypothetical protein